MPPVLQRLRHRGEHDAEVVREKAFVWAKVVGGERDCVCAVGAQTAGGAIWMVVELHDSLLHTGAYILGRRAWTVVDDIGNHGGRNTGAFRYISYGHSLLFDHRSNARSFSPGEELCRVDEAAEVDKPATH